VPATWSTNASPDASNASDVATTLLTEHIRSRGEHRVRRGRPALVTSSTSWTPDEDFGVLLSALLGLDAKIESETSSLRVLVVVTGKGPQKREYEERMSHLRLRNVAVQTLWLEPADYPKLLACADVGVSLHTSTSGLDLPMKVLDLFGCEVPVCALSFACLSELVEDGTNGRVFESAGGLRDLLWELLSPLASEPSAPAHGFGPLATYSANLKGMPRWDDQWKENALPFLLKTIEDARL
jgi:beta-1,4-mannosyltransferase